MGFDFKLSISLPYCFFVLPRKITEKGLKWIGPFQSFLSVHLVLFAFLRRKTGKNGRFSCEAAPDSQGC